MQSRQFVPRSAPTFGLLLAGHGLAGFSCCEEHLHPFASLVRNINDIPWATHAATDILHRSSDRGIHIHPTSLPLGASQRSGGTALPFNLLGRGCAATSGGQATSHRHHDLIRLYGVAAAQHEALRPVPPYPQLKSKSLFLRLPLTLPKSPRRRDHQEGRRTACRQLLPISGQALCDPNVPFPRHSSRTRRIILNDSTSSGLRSEIGSVCWQRPPSSCS